MANGLHCHTVIITLNVDKLIDEFEFLEDSRPATKKNNNHYDEVDLGGNSEEDSGDMIIGNRSKKIDWRPEEYHSSNHTIKWMVRTIALGGS